jgi:hypothetical protein
MDEHTEAQIDEVALKSFKPDGSGVDGLCVGSCIRSAASASVRTTASAAIRPTASACCGSTSGAPSTRAACSSTLAARASQGVAIAAQAACRRCRRPACCIRSAERNGAAARGIAAA